MKNFKIFLFLVLFIADSVCGEAQVVNKVVAVVNNEVITQQDVDRLLAVLYAQYVHSYDQDELLEKMEQLKKDILNQIVEDKLVLSRAKELDIKVRDSEIEGKMEQVKSGFPSEDLFYKTLEIQGITVANLKDRYRDQLMMEKVVDSEIKSKISVLPSEISEYYEDHRSEFRKEPRYKTRHILIKAEDDVAFDLAKVEIEEVYDRLLKGADFAELARQYSQGPNRDKGGDMGYIRLGEMLKEIDNTIVLLKPGEFSGPVRSEIGYHILKLEDMESPGYFTLEEAQNNIKLMLFRTKFKERLDEWVAGLKLKAYISIK